MTSFDRLRRYKVQVQIMAVSLIAFIVPVTILILFSANYAGRKLKERYADLVKAEQIRASSIMFDMTMTVYNSANDLAAAQQLSGLFSSTERVAVARMRQVDDRVAAAEERSPILFGMEIFTNNPAIPGFGRTHYTDDFAGYEWYGKLVGRDFNQWVTTDVAINKNQSMPCLTLVTRINTALSEYDSYLVTSIDYNYLNNRINSTDYYLMMSTEPEDSFFATQFRSIGESLPVPGYDGIHHFQYQGDINWKESRVIAAMASFTPYATPSKVYVLAMDTRAMRIIHLVRVVFAAIYSLSFFVPLFVIRYYSSWLSGRINILMNTMNQVRQGNYEIPNEVSGEDELTDIFLNLKATADLIRQREREYYQGIIRMKELENKQQKIEYKMLESQINPHFLYNTLEVIRMQAVKKQDYDVSASVILLAKNMHYVLESYNRESVTLSEELDYTEKYLSIQKLRFGDRVNWKLYIDDSIHAGTYRMLPLLLQPIVENAITHGLEGLSKNGNISIIAEPEEGFMRITVSDNGSGMNEDTLKEIVARMKDGSVADEPGHIGLRNTYQRIVLFYGSEYGLDIDSRAGIGTRIVMRLPENAEKYFA